MSLGAGPVPIASGVGRSSGLFYPWIVSNGGAVATFADYRGSRMAMSASLSPVLFSWGPKGCKTCRPHVGLHSGSAWGDDGDGGRRGALTRARVARAVYGETVQGLAILASRGSLGSISLYALNCPHKPLQSVCITVEVTIRTPVASNVCHQLFICHKYMFISMIIILCVRIRTCVYNSRSYN